MVDKVRAAGKRSILTKFPSDYIDENGPVSNSPKPLDKNTKDTSVQGWPQAEEKYSQIPAGKR